MDASHPALQYNAESIRFLPALCAAVIVLLALSALFSVSESALLSMNKLRLRIKCRNGERRALRVARLLKHKDVLINSLLAANCLTNISLSSIAAKAALEIWGNMGVSAAALCTTVVLLVFGEITPKTLAARHADTIAYKLSAFVAITVTIFAPLSSLFTMIARGVLHLCGVHTAPPKRSYTEADIRTVIYEGAESGALSQGESEMAQGVFRFTDLEARDIMVPRKDIQALPEAACKADIIKLSRETGHTRFPVYRSNIDDITGTLYVKDLFKINSINERGGDGGEEYTAITAKDIMRPPLFILGGKKMSSVQAVLKDNRQSMAIVVDEYSGTDGILTARDITKRIFDIQPVSPFSPVSGTFNISGDTLIKDVQERLNIPIHSDINETIGGWLSERLGDLPQAGDYMDFCGYRFQVTRCGEHCVENVSVTDTNRSATSMQEMN